MTVSDPMSGPRGVPKMAEEVADPERRPEVAQSKVHGHREFHNPSASYRPGRRPELTEDST